MSKNKIEVNEWTSILQQIIMTLLVYQKRLNLHITISYK